MKRMGRSLFSLVNYFIFFLLVAFVVTCCLLLFLSTMELDQALLRRQAIMTFGNVLFLSLLFTFLDAIRRKVTVERPVKRILEATRRLTKGDFSVRIQSMHGRDSGNEFDIIGENFNQMAQELSGMETLRTDFIANVSHELKTPLAVIQNYAAMLQTPALPEEQRVAYAKTVADASRRLSDLITNILKLNRLENQQIFPKAEEYDLGEQLRRCLLDFEDIWEQKALEIETDIDDHVRIKADRELLAPVWSNLLSNAMKFTPEGGRITVSVKAEGGDAVVSVSDTGCGISPEVGAHLFEKFYQGDTSHAAQGNGLGLALVRRVMDILGGDITVESTPGTGSTFAVKLGRGDDGAD